MSKTDFGHLLGVGLYSTAEAARYVRVRTQKLSRWLYGTKSTDSVIEPQLEDSGERIVTFLDFAQSLSLYDIRLSAKIPLQKIRAAYLAAKKEHGVRYPLAVEHGIFVFGDLARPERCELGIYVPKPGTDPLTYAERTCYQLTGKKKGSQLISQIVSQFSKNLTFEVGGTANRYLAFSKYGHNIVMDPQYRFGKPYLEDLGYEAETLAEAVAIEGSVSRVCKIYHVDSAAVKAALEYRQQLTIPPKSNPPRHIAA